MKKGVQEEELNTADNIQQEVVPIKRKRGRPPSKNKNQNAATENRKLQRTLELQNEEKHPEFQYPPQIPFTGFDLDQNLKESSISTLFFRNIIDKILGLWWNGSSPILCDDTKIIKYELVFNMFRYVKHIFNTMPPFLIISNPENINQWLSTFIGYHSYLFTDNENDTVSDIFYTNKSKTKLDVLILSSEQDLSNFSLTDFSLLILDQPSNFDNFSSLEALDAKSKFLICNSATENVPSVFDFDNHILITLEDIKNNRYVSETLHFCPMTQFQILQIQQLFKSNKSRLHQIPEPPSERFTMFLSHIVKQVKSISVHPSLSTNYNSPVDDQSGKFQELLKVVRDLQISENKIAIIGQDSQLLKFTASYFIKNKINAYNVNQLLKGKKKVQLIEEYNQSDSSSLLLIDPENFFEFHSRLIIDKIIILEVEISLDSMIDEILSWQQSQHDNTPQIIRLITDNSIELPIYEIQFNNQTQEGENEGENQEEESKKVKKEEEIQSQFYDFDKMKPETLLLLLKQSAILCFETEGEEPRKPMEVCYSHSPTKLFEIETEFHQNFWNDITQIEFQDQKSHQQKLYKQQSRLGNHSKRIDSEDNSSIATRVKKEFLRRARFVDQEKTQKNDKNKSKMSTRNSNKKELTEIDEIPLKKTKLKKSLKVSRSSIKNRQSPRQKKLKKYNDSDSISDDEIETENDDENENETESEDDEDDESETENENEDEDEKKDIDDFNNDEEEEEDAQEQEESENEIENQIEESESDENDSIASRKKKRLLKLQQLQQKIEEKANKKAAKLNKKAKSTKITKLSKKSSNSPTKKSPEPKIKQSPPPPQPQTLQKPRKHIPKFDSMVAFWNPRQFTHYLEILRDFGFDRWDKFSIFERPIQELRKIGALIIRNLETTSRENRLLREYFANELRSSELSRLDNALPFVRRKLSKINRSDFLADLTGMLLIAKLSPKSVKDIILPKACYEIDPLDQEWTEDDDRNLIYLIYENGLFHIPTTFKHHLNKNFIKRFRSFFTVDPSTTNSPNIISLTSGTASLPKAKTGVTIYESKQTNQNINSKITSIKKKGSSLSSKSKTKNQSETSSVVIKPARGIGLKLHIAIIRTLCSYGYPNLARFKLQMNNIGTVTDADLEDYIETIFNYSTCTVKEERRLLSLKLAGKIEKYTATKIISRKNMFEKIRKDAVNYDDISAEDIELLSAMAFHGFANTETSPVLLSSCGGECSDQRLLQRMKAIAMQEQIHNEEPISFFISQYQQQQQQQQADDQQIVNESAVESPEFNGFQPKIDDAENQLNSLEQTFKIVNVNQNQDDNQNQIDIENQDERQNQIEIENQNQNEIENENHNQVQFFEQQQKEEDLANHEIIQDERESNNNNDQEQFNQPNNWTEPDQTNNQIQSDEHQQFDDQQFEIPTEQHDQEQPIEQEQDQLTDQDHHIESFEHSIDQPNQQDELITPEQQKQQPDQEFDQQHQFQDFADQHQQPTQVFDEQQQQHQTQDFGDQQPAQDFNEQPTQILDEQQQQQFQDFADQQQQNQVFNEQQQPAQDIDEQQQDQDFNEQQPNQIINEQQQPAQDFDDQQQQPAQDFYDQQQQQDQVINEQQQPAQDFNDQQQQEELEDENEASTLEESLFPLRLNDRQVLKSIGTIDPRFHDEDYIYPVGYECSVACTNPFNDSQNLVWLNLTIRLLNMKIDKSDRMTNNGDFLIFVIRKEREKSPEISDSSPEKVFEKVRQRIIRKTKTWIPPFDGNEMFGFNSAKVHRILAELPNIEHCTRYRRRFFRLPMQIDHEWPILGRYEDKKKLHQMYTMFTSGENGVQNKSSNSIDFLSSSSSLPPSLNSASISLNKKLKNLKKLNQKVTSKKEKIKQEKGEKSQLSLMKKKEFGNLLKPLVINCRPIFDSGMEEASVSVSGTPGRLDQLMRRYQKWDQEIIDKYIQKIDQ